jgi:hypothetical protein
MNFAAKIHTSWELMQSSLRVIRDHPRLALFPVISSLCALSLALFFIVPLVVLRVGQAGEQAWLAQHGWNGAGLEEIRQWGKLMFYTFGAVVYLLSLFVAAFFNTAFYHEILRALAGADVSIGGGLRFAVGRIRAILWWSLLAGTVGLIIRAIEERLGWLGKLVMAAIGTVWSVAAVFAIPVIVRRDESNPLAVLRDSALTLKRTWGESLVGFVGIKLAGVALALGVLVGVGSIVLLTMVVRPGWFVVALSAMWFIAVMVAGFVIHLATHVYRCALYVYATEGVVPAPYTAEMMNAGWKIRKP